MNNDDTSSGLQYPEEECKDTLTEWIEAGISAVPIVGSPFAKAFGILANPKINQRREEFLRDVAIKINQLSRQIEALKPEKLKDNDIFISVLIEATNIAIKTHQQEKREALRNAVLNSVVIDSLKDDEKLMFTNIVDTTTPTHIVILKFYSSGEYFVHNNISSYYDYFITSFPDSHIDGPFFESITNDLVTKGLLDKGESSTYDNPNPISFLRLIDISVKTFTKKFLQFISEPEIPKDK